MSGRLVGRRVLVTTANNYLGPAIVELFEKEGAELIADTSDYTEPGAVESIVDRAGRIDVFVPIFAGPERLLPLTNMTQDATEATDEDLQAYIDILIWPMVRFIRAVLPQMYERGSGKVVAVTSATPMRGFPGIAIYSGARGYQNAFLGSVGIEAAPRGVQVNGIGPAMIENPAYFSTEMLSDDALRQTILDTVPAAKMGDASDAAELVLALAGDASNFLAGQIIPVGGGWAQR